MVSQLQKSSVVNFIKLDKVYIAKTKPYINNWQKLGKTIDISNNVI